MKHEVLKKLIATLMEESPESMMPALPPGLAELNSVSRSEFLKQMERHPLFMHSLDQSDANENPELEALKALAYEGTPLEIAQNFKVQGNEAFHEHRYRDALEFYTKGLAAKSEDPELDRTLLLNRAAVNLELGKYVLGGYADRRKLQECVEGLWTGIAW